MIRIAIDASTLKGVTSVYAMTVLNWIQTQAINALVSLIDVMVDSFKKISLDLLGNIFVSFQM